MTVNTLSAKDGDLRLSASNACLPKTEISVFVTECVFFTSKCELNIMVADSEPHIIGTRRVPVQRAVESDENTLPVKVHDATLRPLLNIMDSASHNPVASATVRNLRSLIVI